ncbi:MAG: DUF1844 domain-containing protein [Candidatus Goldbacteria bacterium]|nr:DUF1844 domain-containing protein [Candidatus Goldiibacteriota bacterium]
MDVKKEDNVDFINLILMLNQNTLISLGEAARFVSGKKQQNLPMARQTINMIKAIADKTAGKLTPGESKLVFRILGELQQKYVVAAGLMKPPEGTDYKIINSPKAHQEVVDKALDKLSDGQLQSLLAELMKKADGENK